MTAACHTSVEAFLRQAEQQLPALARGLHANQLQEFLCRLQALMQSKSTGTEAVIEVCCQYNVIA